MSSKKNSLKYKLIKIKKVIFPILLISVFGLILFFNNSNPSSILIGEVTPTLPICSNFVSSSISRSKLAPLQKFTYTCDFGSNQLDCLLPNSAPHPLETNKFLKYSRNKAIFEATAPRIPGQYTIECKLGNSPTCSEKGLVPCIANPTKKTTFTVTGKIVDPISGLGYTCSNNNESVDIFWSNLTDYPKHLIEFYSSISSEIIKNDDYTETQIKYSIKPNTEYAVYIQTKGLKNALSAPVSKIFSCQSNPTNLKPINGAQLEPGISTITWDKITNVTGYVIMIDDTSPGTKPGACGTQSDPGDVCNSIAENSFQYNFLPNKTYRISVQSFSESIDNRSGTTISDVSIKNIPSPNNLKQQCGSDGKTVTLTWDGMNNINSYKLRLKDNSTQKTFFYDNLKSSRLEVNIDSDQKYTWWTHAHRDGVDSQESAKLEFSCVKPSPSPTPIRTAKPSATPTPSLSATPSASLKPSLKPSPSPTLKPSLKPSSTPQAQYTPIPTPIPQTNNDNIFVKFWKWLTAIF